MLECRCCPDIRPFPVGAALDRHNAPVVEIDDPVWESLTTAARLEADREAVLRPQLDRYVLQRSSLADALATLLSDKLGDELVTAGQLDREFADIVCENRKIGASLSRDLLAIEGNDPAVDGPLQPFLNFKGFHAVALHRIAHQLWNVNRRALARHLQSRGSERFGIDIHPAAQIGDGVWIDHATGVVIGETAVVGNDVTILHGVTLGSTGKQRGDRHPKVGDGVFIGAAAQLLGNIQIGAGSSVGAGSVVLSSVEPDCTVAGVPARVVRRSPQPTIAINRFGDARA